MFTNKHRFPISCLTLATSPLTRISRKVSARHCRQTLLAFFLAAITISCDGKHQSQNGESKPKRFQTVTINNIEPRRDVAGEIIDAHGGCLQLFGGRFYLYGTAYGTNETSLTLNCPFRVYSSPDLERWTYEGELLKEQPSSIYSVPVWFSIRILTSTCFGTTGFPNCGTAKLPWPPVTRRLGLSPSSTRMCLSSGFAPVTPISLALAPVMAVSSWMMMEPVITSTLPWAMDTRFVWSA